VRAFLRAKGTTLILLLSLALGTGANAAVYTTLDALLFRGPAGIGRPGALFSVHTSEYGGFPYGATSHPDYLSVRDTHVFAALAAIDDETVENVRVDQSGGAVRIAAVPDDFFGLLQMQAYQGELRTSATGDVPSAVVSQSFAEMVALPVGIVGKTLVIGERSYTITGVTPPRFRGLQAGRECDVWIHQGEMPTARGNRRFAVVGRLASGVSLPRAQEQLDRLAGELATQFPRTNRGSALSTDAPRRFTIARYSHLSPGTRSQTILLATVIGGASVLLLVSACLNAGGLLLSWAVSRRRELATRMALGAVRARLIRQLLLETFSVSVAGGACGLLLAYWISQILPALFMSEQAAQLDTHIDASMTLLTIGVACVAGMILGVAPALHGTSASALTALRGDTGVSQEHGGRRLRAILVSAQVALSTVLLLATGVLVMSLGKALEGELGSTIKQIAVVSIELPGKFHDTVKGLMVRQQLIERLTAVNGVISVGWANTLPLGRGNRSLVEIEGDSSEVTDTREVETNVVSPGYFYTLSLERTEGRVFDGGDGARADRVAVVDELLAQRFFGPKAVGRHVIDRRGMEPQRVEIIGVVRSGRYRTLQQEPQPTIFYAASQDYLYRGFLLLRTRPAPAKVLDAIRAEVASVGGGATALRIATLETLVDESLAVDRMTTTLVGICGVIALAMSTMGVFGIMTDAVHRKTREIGLRLALGARPLQIARLVIREAAYPAVAGLSIGSLGILAVTRLAQTFVYGVPPIDVRGLALSAAALAVAIALAAVIPLRRALRIHPNIALRAE
jgi:putative ABC transport system permease protein